MVGLGCGKICCRGKVMLNKLLKSTMVRVIIGLMGPLSLGWAADSPEIRDQAPQHYTVVHGDTLWGIAARFLNDPWAWPAVWQANPQIHNPHLIYPGNVILLCSIHGQKILAVDPGGGCSAIEARMSQQGGSSVAEEGVVHLEPQVLDQGDSSVIPTIPLRAILPYLNASRVVDPDHLKAAPYVIAGNNGHLSMGTGDQAYVRGKAISQQTYAMFRPARSYLDPETHELLGEQANYVCDVKATDTQSAEKVTLVTVGRMKDALQIGDRMLPIKQSVVVPVYYPKAADGVKPGRVLGVLGGLDNAGKYDVIVINRGARDKVEEGHVVSLFHHGMVVEDRQTSELIRLPDELEGVAMVFRVFPKVSYALILKSTTPVHVGDDSKPPHSGDF